MLEKGMRGRCRNCTAATAREPQFDLNLARISEAWHGGGVIASWLGLGNAEGAANATPVEGQVDWPVPQTRPGHTAKVRHNLLETTKSIRLANGPG